VPDEPAAAAPPLLATALPPLPLVDGDVPAFAVSEGEVVVDEQAIRLAAAPANSVQSLAEIAMRIRIFFRWVGEHWRYTKSA
jgi:hypothetical protein